MRHFIRHPTDIPFEYHISDAHQAVIHTLSNVSHGGLAFQAEECFPVGTIINIRIPLREPAFVAKGVVVWCRKSDNVFEIGVEFRDHQTEHAVRMVEQVAYIEHYKKEVLEKEGRILSGKEAAFEWISKYASGFPD